MDLNNIHKEKTWEEKKKCENFTFCSFDFSNTNFNYPIFSNIIFENCLFNKSKLEDARLYNCNFIRCNFIKVDLRTATLGCHNGIFENCNFEECDFRNGFFYNPEFINCIFDKCKLKRIDFKASYFESCKFIGKMEDITFRGKYKDDIIPNAKQNSMNNIDFSEAVFGEFVGFEECDLSTCIPPQGKSFEKLFTILDNAGLKHLSTGNIKNRK